MQSDDLLTCLQFIFCQYEIKRETWTMNVNDIFWLWMERNELIEFHFNLKSMHPENPYSTRPLDNAENR